MQAPVQPRASALLPLLLFLLIFLGSGIYYSLTGTDFAFYQIKAPVAILPAIILGLLLAKPSYRDNLQTFIDGIGDRNIITMLDEIDAPEGMAHELAIDEFAWLVLKHAHVRHERRKCKPLWNERMS